MAHPAPPHNRGPRPLRPLSVPMPAPATAATWTPAAGPGAAAAESGVAGLRLHAGRPDAAPGPVIRTGGAGGFRVLHVIPGLDPRDGGPPASVSRLALAQKAAGVRVRVLTAAAAGSDRRVIDRLRAGGVPVDVLPAGGRVSGRVAAGRRWTAEGVRAVAQADAVHLHGLWEEAQPRVALAARRAGVPYVVSPRGMLAPWSLARGRVKKLVYFEARVRRMLDAAAAVHVTTAEEGRLFAPLGLAAPRVTVPNGVNPHEFAAPDAAAFRASVPQLKGHRGPLAVFLGRLHPVKGLEELIPAFASLAGSGGPAAGAKLALVGPGDARYAAKLRRLAARCGAGDAVAFCGMRHGADRANALAAADLFTLPSHQENFGVAAAEALACGTPVLLGEGVNLAAEVAGAGVGAVCATERGALAEELRRWLSDPAACRRAGERARRFAARYHEDAVAARWSAVWADLAGEGRTTAAPLRKAA